MKLVWIASISLAASFTLASSAMAQQSLQQRFPWMFQGQNKNDQKLSTTVTLVQKIKPVTLSYPGVSADILGIRTGMTVAQAEAIAEKNYLGKPMEHKAQELFKYKEVTVASQPFVQVTYFVNHATETSDQLALYFGSPVTGNTLYAVGRDIKFGDNGKFGGDPANSPLFSSVEAGLVTKYGTPSYRNIQSNYGVFAWTFSVKSRVSCDAGSCINSNVTPFSPVTPIGQLSEPTNTVNYFSMNSLGVTSLPCAADVDHPISLMIYAYIHLYSSDPTKADEMQVAVWDGSTCIKGNEEASKQLNAAAIKFYNTVSKAPAAPKM